MNRPTASLIGLALVAGSLLVAHPAAATDGTRTVPHLDMRLDIAPGDIAAATFTLDNLPDALTVTIQWWLLHAAPVHGSCAMVQWHDESTGTVDQHPYNQGSITAGNGTIAVDAGRIGDGCYSLAAHVLGSTTTEEVRLSAGSTAATVLNEAESVASPRGNLGETRLFFGSEMLQETDETYPWHSAARNVVIARNVIDHAVWNVVEVAPGEFRLINKATGNALQATNEVHSAGRRNVVATPASWDNEYQRWRAIESWDGGVQYVTLVNVGLGTTLAGTGQPYLHGGNAYDVVHWLWAARWNVASPIDFDGSAN